MSYIAYINGNQIELSDIKPIAQTKQVNDIARLDNRQTNFTNKFTVPLTANNVRVMDRVYLVGNQSNIPYQKNVFDLFDADNGECLIYKGWANVTKTTNKGYEINVYDGLVDFYRTIENLSLTDVDVSGLNHAKSLTNIINSWNNTQPYLYAIADYNGKNTYTDTLGNEVYINADFQVPSARVSYIWDRVFAFAGYTYSGIFFNSEKFKNLFMSYPKPVPKLVPNRILIYAGVCYPRHSTYYYFESGGAYLSAESYLLSLPRENFTTTYASVTNNNASTPITAGGSVYDWNPINILVAGTYSIDAFAPDINYNFVHIHADGSPNTFGSTELDLSGTFKTHLFSCVVGDKILLLIDTDPYTILTLTFNWQLNKIDGYVANFEEALVDFKVTVFVNEILQHGGLTAFKDKYKNHIDFKSVDELLLTDSVLDWSNKYQGKTSEVYKFGNYAKKNNFKYRYNEENETHNDGAIYIDDANLIDETTILQSKIYSPEKSTSLISNQETKVFKIWEKEVKDDASLEYKELTGRFYFMRFKLVPVATTIGSEIITDTQSITQMAIADYSGLNFNALINTNYGTIVSILDKAKLLEVPFYLSSRDVANFDFKSLIYVEQLASYYLVNKIVSFIKTKVTKCEVLKLDYKKIIPVVIPPDNGTYINLLSVDVAGCEVTLNFDTDAMFPVQIRILGSAATFGGAPDPYLDVYDETITATSNTINLTLLRGGFWEFRLYFDLQPLIYSNSLTLENFTTCIYNSGPANFLTITSVETISVISNVRKIKVNFITDFAVPLDILLTFSFVGILFGGFTQTFSGVSSGYVIVDVQNSSPALGNHNVLIGISSGGLFNTAVESNTITSYPIKWQIKESY